MSGVKIEFKDLSKRYKDVLAVSNFSAQVQSGRVTGFLGPNGAGKEARRYMAAHIASYKIQFIRWEQF